MRHKVALICTTHNCKDELQPALETFTAGDNLALLSEIVIVDGGSTDGTWELLGEWADKIDALRVYQVAGANISRGRNEAIKRTDAGIIVTFDSGTAYEANWLQLMLQPFEDPKVDVVGGLTISVGDSFFQRCYAAFDDRKHTDASMGSSHRGIAYRRKVWEDIGGYPEHVQAGEDTWFNLQWRKRGCTYVHLPEARTYWTVRKDWLHLFRMARRNSKGHVALGRNAATITFALITLVYLVCASCLVASLVSSALFYLALTLYALYVGRRMLAKGRWRVFLHPTRFIMGLYVLAAWDLGTALGTIEGAWVLLNHRMSRLKASGNGYPRLRL